MFGIKLLSVSCNRVVSHEGYGQGFGSTLVEFMQCMLCIGHAAHSLRNSVDICCMPTGKLQASCWRCMGAFNKH